MPRPGQDGHVLGSNGRVQCEEMLQRRASGEGVGMGGAEGCEGRRRWGASGRISGAAGVEQGGGEDGGEEVETGYLGSGAVVGAEAEGLEGGAEEVVDGGEEEEEG